MEFNIPSKYKNRAGVYIIRNSLDHRFYIGSTYDFTVRFKNHGYKLKVNTHGSKKLQNFYNKYGTETLSFEMLETVPDISRLIEREQKYLDVYRPWDNKIGFNHAIYAGSPTRGTKWDEERRVVASARFSREGNPFFGKRHSHEMRLERSLNNGRKIAKTCPETGEIVVEYDSPYLAAKEENLNSVCLTDACRKGKKYKGFYWKYISEPIEKSSFTDKIHSEESKTKISLAKGTKISKMDLNGNIICEYPTSRHAAQETGFDQTNINAACRSGKKYHGCLWAYAESPKNCGRVGEKSHMLGKSPDADSLIKMSRRKTGPVLQFDLDKNLIKEYPSLYEAHLELGIPSRRISSVCRRSQKQYNGFVFRFKNGVNIKSPKKIKRLDRDGNTIETFNTLVEVCEKFDISDSVIYSACKKEKELKGSFWRIINE